MGYSVIIDGKFERPVASYSGWREFDLFLDKWPEVKDFTNIKHLFDHGWDQDLPLIRGELVELLKHDPSPSVASTIRDLIVTIDAAPKDATHIELTDGVIEEDDWDGEGDEVYPGDDEPGPSIEPPIEQQPIEVPVKKVAAKRVRKAAVKRSAKVATAKKASVKRPLAKKAAVKKVVVKKVVRKAASATRASAKKATTKGVKKAVKKVVKTVVKKTAKKGKTATKVAKKTKRR